MERKYMPVLAEISDCPVRSHRLGCHQIDGETVSTRKRNVPLVQSRPDTSVDLSPDAPLLKRMPLNIALDDDSIWGDLVDAPDVERREYTLGTFRIPGNLAFGILHRYVQVRGRDLRSQTPEIGSSHPAISKRWLWIRPGAIRGCAHDPANHVNDGSFEFPAFLFLERACADHIPQYPNTGEKRCDKRSLLLRHRGTFCLERKYEVLHHHIPQDRRGIRTRKRSYDNIERPNLIFLALGKHFPS